MGNVRSGRDIDSALRKKGFHCETKGDHFYYHYFSLAGERTSIKTKISHGIGGGTIGAPLISVMSQQIHLSKQQFLDFVDCTLTEE